MTDKIHPSLRSMAVDIDSLELLDGNPRIGNIDAIMSSYEEFGQVKPIVARKNDDGTATVIAGNHQLQAAQSLGWDKIAVVFLEADDKRAVAFAIADNRTMELGYTEPELLNEMLLEVSEFYPELMEGLGWDEFELAAIETEILIEENSILGKGSTDVEEEEEQSEYEAAQESSAAAIKGMVQKDESGEGRIVANSNLDHSDIAVRGSTVAVPGSAPQAAVQYTIVFDSTDQQSRWYDFVRWLKGNTSIDGSTTAERLLNFIDEHCEI